ncbi:hypothetical protein [Amycolatopsis australiensis]|uniref:Butirosin biosynthesis protein H, N-terminal n=1 Tax=Amycolatopsis australiensis TaxID=546364 RepID=A0A1K1SBE7_9PSEU|nr:hypothetical protein [Amycolatopsis australiensis]SFW81420.1 hypothetical protein SAMN04489730_5179 [Amycolatopsis australiensis]
MTDGLSCYTANLAAYLEHHGAPGSADLIAVSVRLAVDLRRPDGLVAVSHHDRPLDRMGDGTRLTYRGHDGFAGFRADLDRELLRHGCALVVGHSTQLPWAAQREGTAAPHFLLVDGHDGDRWHVEDRFTGLMTSGRRQEPFTGWIAEADLDRLARRTGPEPAKHRLRNTLAFGFENPVPAGCPYLLLRRQSRPVHPNPLPAPWVTGTVEALDALGTHLAGSDALVRDPDVVDDCWAAAQHHLCSHRRLGRHLGFRTTSERRRAALAEAVRCWEKLPRTLRFAATSAWRGRPRPELVRAAFTELAAREHEAAEALTGAVLVTAGAGD